MTASGLRRTRRVISVAIPSVPSEPMNAPSRSGPSGSRALPPSSTISPSGSTTVSPVTWLTVKPFLRQWAPPEFSATLPADRADLLARGIGRVEEAVRRDRPGDVEVRDAGLDDDPLRGEVDLEDPVHPRERDDDSLRNGQRAAGQPGAGAAGDERHAFAGADADDALHLGGRAGEDDELRHRAPAREPVAVVDAELLGLRDHVPGADDGRDLGADGGGERHLRESTASRKRRTYR